MCLDETAWQELFTWRKLIPTYWDFICVEVRSQLGRMNPFSYKWFVFGKKWNTPFCWKLTQVRYSSQRGCLTLYKQPLNLLFGYAKQKTCLEFWQNSQILVLMDQLLRGFCPVKSEIVRFTRTYFCQLAVQIFFTGIKFGEL